MFLALKSKLTTGPAAFVDNQPTVLPRKRYLNTYIVLNTLFVNFCLTFLPVILDRKALNQKLVCQDVWSWLLYLHVVSYDLTFDDLNFRFWSLEYKLFQQCQSRNEVSFFNTKANVLILQIFHGLRFQ